MATVLMLVTNPVNPDPRVEREAQALAESGLEVRVLGTRGARSLPNACIHSGGFEILRTSSRCILSRNPKLGWLAPVLDLLQFHVNVVRILPRALEDVAVVHCHDFDTLLLGFLCSRLIGARLVYDSHEAFSAMFSARVPDWVRKVVDSIEALLARRSCVITVGTLLSRRFRRMTGVEAVVVRNVPAEWEYVAQKTDSDAFVVGFVGALIQDRSIEPLIQGFKVFRQNHPESALRIAGSGPQEHLVIDAAAASNSAIVHESRIPYSAVPKFLSQVSISTVLYTRTNANAYYSSPNKLFESGLSGVPVLASNFGELCYLVRKYKLGFVVDPDSPEKIAEALERIHERRNELKQMGIAARETVLREFPWKLYRERLLSTYSRLLSQTSSRRF